MYSLSEIRNLPEGFLGVSLMVCMTYKCIMIDRLNVPQAAHLHVPDVVYVEVLAQHNYQSLQYNKVKVVITQIHSSIENYH